MTLAPEKRIGTRLAATYLGVTPKHVIRLIQAGAIDGVDVRLPGASRPTWAVALSSVRRFLAERAANIGLDGPSDSARGDARCEARDSGRQ